MKVRSNPFLSALLALFSAVPATQAANFYWDGAAVVVNGASAGGSAAWTVGAPGWEDATSAQNWADGNLAIFGGTGGTVTLGGAISASGIQVGASSAAYSVTAASRQVLTLGTSGIDLGAATSNLPLNNLTLAVGGNSQTWNVASGRSLFLSATNALNGQLTGTNAATITVSGGGLVDLLTNVTGLGGYAGNWLVQGGSTLRTLRNNAAALGTGTVTLNGGTLATGGFQGTGAQGNWTFNNALILDTGTNIIDNQLPTGGTPGNRWLKLDGVISGSGNIAFHNSQFVNGVMTSDENGFILAAANTFTGSITIDPNAFLRIGGSAVGVADANAGNNGSIAPTVAISNSGVLRLTRNDTWTLANSISGDGQVKIGGASGTTTSQVATLSGASTYTGATTVINGTLNLTGSLTSPITVNSGSKLRGAGSTSDSLTMNAGSTLIVAGDATTTSVAANGVTFAGATTLLFASPPLAGTVYDLFTYGAGAVTGIENFPIIFRGTLTDDTLNKKYTFAAGGVGTRTWNSALNDGYWDNGVAPNWLEGDKFFYGGDTAIFGDISADAPIQLEGKLAPASVTVHNAANTYTFTGMAGAHEITGTTSLTKDNAGTLAIASPQSYTGGTTINGGILDLTGGGGGVGVIRGTVTVNTGGTLQLSTNDATGFNTDATRVSVINLVGGTLNVNTALNQTLGSTVINMTGANITGITGSNLDLFANGSVINTLASATTSTISLPSMNLRQNDTAFNIADGAAAVDLLISSNLGNGSAGNHNLVKNSAGTMVLSGTNNTYTGATTVAGGTLAISGTITGTSTVTINGAGSLLVPTGGSLTATGALATAIATGASIVVESGATLTAASSTIAWNPGTFKIDGALNVTGAFTVSTNATAPLTGAGTITAGSFTVGNAATVVNYSTAAMNVSGVLKLGTATAAHSTTFNQTAGIITTGGLQLGDAASTTAQSFSLTGGTLKIGSSGIFTAGLGARNLSLGSATVGAAAAWSSNLPTTLTSTTTGTTFDTTGGNISLSNVLSGVGAKLVKSGSGFLILTGINTYTGDTVVDGGTLAVNGTSIANTGKLVINTGGKVDASGTEVVDTLFFGGAQQAAGTWGSTSSAATNKNDTYFSGTGVVSVTNGVVGGYSTWAAANAGGGTATGDFDNDGVRNGVEYFMGTTGSSFTANPGIVGGKITWPKDPAYSGTYTVQTSPDLVTWTNVTSTVVGNTVEYTLPTGQEKLFVRLDVTPN